MGFSNQSIKQKNLLIHYQNNIFKFFSKSFILETTIKASDTIISNYTLNKRSPQINYYFNNNVNNEFA